MKKTVLRLAFALLAAFAVSAAWAQDPSERAIQVLDQLDAGQYQQVAGNFDEQMAAAMDVDTLGQVWASVPQQLGALQSRGEPQASQQDGMDVVVVPVQYERALANVTLAFNAEGELAGLFIQPAEDAPAGPPAPAAEAADEP